MILIITCPVFQEMYDRTLWLYVSPNPIFVENNRMAKTQKLIYY